MPIYDYVCSACDHRLEVVHGIAEEGPRFCSACGADGTMKKVFVPPAIHFKGSGWAKKDRSATSKPGKPAPAKAEDAASSVETPASTATSSSTAKATSSDGDKASSGKTAAAEGD